MGIINIHILKEEFATQKFKDQIQIQAAHEGRLMRAHRRGLHPYGSMRRDCPLCQADK